jgi:hypothetical protein
MLAAEFGLRRIDEVAQPLRRVSRRQLFTVPLAGGERFPGFQFAADGAPLPAITAVLVAVEGRVGGWELALWFVSGNDVLAGRRPVDVLDDPGPVAAAVRRLLQTTR